MTFDEMFYSVKGPDEMVHVHDGHVVLDGAKVHTRDFEIWPIDPEPV